MNIRSKLTIAITLASIIPLTVSGMIFLRQSQNALKEQISVSSLEFAQLTTTAINLYLHEEYEENQILASLDTLQEVVNDDKDGRISKLLIHIESIEYDKDDYYLAALNVNGQVVASSNPEIIGVNYSKEKWFQAAMNGIDGMEDVAYHKPAGGYALILSSPIKDLSDSTKVIGVMLTALKWEGVNELNVGLKLRGKKQNVRDHIMLTNKDGLAISCFDPDEMFTDNLVKMGMKSSKYAQEGKEGNITEISEHGHLSFSTYTYFKKHKEMPSQGWLLILLQDPESVFAPVARLQKIFIFMLVVTLLLCVIVSFLLADTFSKPILAVSEVTQAIGRGELAKKVTVTSKDEIGVLADSVNKMGEDLQKTINEKLEIAEQLQQAQKMESIGTMASGIAHSFNNILGAIRGYVEMTIKKLPSDGQEYSNLKEVIDGVDEAKEFIAKMLDFSHQDKHDLRAIHMHSIVQDALELFNASLIRPVEIRQNIETLCGAVLADANQIKQLILNLCTNSYHSMDKTKGVIEVSLTEVKIDADLVSRYRNLHKGSYVCLGIKDVGQGMDEATKERLFEPFFTTKAVGEGTGLGLSVVRGIVMNHNGEITVDSKPGKGTEINIYFPLSGENLKKQV